MGISRIIYGCSACGKEFNPPSYNDPSMGVLSYKRIFNRESVGNHHHSIGINDQEIYLCDKCRLKLEKSLKDLGLTSMYDGCSSVSF